MPNLKSLYPAAPAAPPPAPPQAETAVEVEPGHEETAPPSPVAQVEPASESEQEELSEIWQKMSLLNEELARATLDRDQALHDLANLREQMRRTRETREEQNHPPSTEELAKLAKERDDAIAHAQGLRVQVLQAKDAASGSAEELAKLTKERDEALAEGQTLRAQLLEEKDAARENEAAASGRAQEMAILTHERDQSRRQYADLRADFEKLKAEQAPREETVKFRKEWEQQLDELKRKLEEKDKEIAALKTSAETAGGADEKIKQEIASLRQQMAKSKEEASIAQRGLALSQMALQQTRDTLREATEGTSVSRHNFDNLKNECALLAQQNTVLQAQIDQLTRDLNAAKAKVTTRLL